MFDPGALEHVEEIFWDIVPSELAGEFDRDAELGKVVGARRTGGEVAVDGAPQPRWQAAVEVVAGDRDQFLA